MRIGRHFWFTSSLIAAAFAAGCSGAGTGDLEQADDAAGKADVVRPSGNYTNASPKIGEITFLALNADRSYSRTIQVVDCIPAGAHCGDDQGTYRFTRAGTHRYIRFDSNGNSERYEYILSGTQLQLNAVDTGELAHFYTLQSVQNWAQEGQACAGGLLGIHKDCAPGLVCTAPAASCCDLVSTCQKPKGRLGDRCGGFVANALQCDTGLVCKLDGNYPDASGTCQKALGQIGDQCGGFVANAVQCDTGLICKLDGNYPDASGTCQAAQPVDCAPEQCGFRPAVAELCADGSAATLSCQPQADGTCGWSFLCN